MENTIKVRGIGEILDPQVIAEPHTYTAYLSDSNKYLTDAFRGSVDILAKNVRKEFAIKRNADSLVVRVELDVLRYGEIHTAFIGNYHITPKALIKLQESAEDFHVSE